LRALWLALLLVLAASPAGAVRYLVAVGNDEGLVDDVPLRFATSDAERVKDVMVDLGGVASARAVVLVDEGVSDLERALLRLRGQVEETRRRGERAEVFISYSGHGDVDSLHVRGERLPVSKLLAWVDDVGADVTVVLIDACRTSTIRSGRGKGALLGESFDVTLIDEPSPRGRVVLSSASAGEVAQESDDLEGAFFTHHLLAGLRGAADANRDGVVVLQELYAYAHSRTLAGSFEQARVQHPEMTTALSGQGELVLSRLGDADAVLTLDDDVAGRLLVQDGRSGRVLFEVQKPAGSALALAVPVRRLRVQQRARNSTAVADVDVARSGARLRAADFVVVERLASRSRGLDDSVDPTPWGLSLGLLSTTATALPLPVFAVGLAARGEHRLGSTPLFLEVEASGHRATTELQVRSFAEHAGRLAVGVDAEAWLPPGRLRGGVRVGADAVWQRIERLDAARLALVGLDTTPQDLVSVGPFVGVDAGLWVPVVAGVAVDVAAFSGLSLHVVDAALAPRLWGGLRAGVAVEF
jgi:hypothetical protein